MSEHKHNPPTKAPMVEDVLLALLDINKPAYEFCKTYPEKLVPAAEEMVGVATVDFLLAYTGGRAALAAHKGAHRDRDDDACPCYAQGWRDGHEAERRPPGA